MWLAAIGQWRPTKLCFATMWRDLNITKQDWECASADEAKQIDDAVDEGAGVGGSASLVQAIPTQLINNGRVEAHEQPCSIHFGNRLLRPAAGL